MQSIPPAKTKKFKPIRKNDPDAVAFRLVCRARDFGDNEEEVGDSGTHTWERVPFGKHERVGVPRDVYMGLSPEDFGIYPHLTRAERIRLCLDIYGVPHIPTEVLEKFGHTTGTWNDNCGKDGDHDVDDDDLFDEACGGSACAAGDLSEGELDFVIRHFGKECVVQDITPSLDSINCDTGEGASPAAAVTAKHNSLRQNADKTIAPTGTSSTAGTDKRGLNSKQGDSELSHLDSDCYFPADGYNYDKHLRTVGLGGGIFIAAPVDKHNPINKPDTAPVNDVDDVTAELLCSDEGKELLAAMQLGGGVDIDPAFELSEDFANQADGIDERVEKEMLWGGHGEAYWYSTASTTTAANTRALTMTREERIALMEAKRHTLCTGGHTAEDSSSDEDDFDCMLDKMMDTGGTDTGTDTVENFNAAFDRILADYDEDFIGELDADDPDVLADTNDQFSDYTMMFEEFLKGNTEKNHVWVRHLKVHNDPTDNVLPPQDAEHTELTRQYLLREAETVSSNGESTDEDAEAREPEWDCETVLTTRSSVYHHPQRIGRPTSKVKVQTKLKVAFEGLTPEQQNSVRCLAQSGMSRDVKTQHKTGHSKGTSEARLGLVAEEHDVEDEIIELPEVQHRRIKGETPDERRERKKLIKGTQREIRRLKKESKTSVKNVEQEVRTKLAQKNAYDIREGTRHIKYT